MIRNLIFGLVEIAAAVGLGFIVIKQLGADPFANAAGLIVGSFGVLHGIHRLFIGFEFSSGTTSLLNRIENTDQKLGEKVVSGTGAILANINMLDQKVNLSSLDQLYKDIGVEFQYDKDSILENARNLLSDLAARQESTPMEKGKYYNWISQAFQRTNPKDQIFAISRMKSTEWEDTPEERRFIEENVSAGKNGVNIERIFVAKTGTFDAAIGHASKPQSKNNIGVGYVFRQHSRKIKNGITGRFADEDRIQRENPRLLDQVGDGFLMFIDGQTQDTVVLVDNFTEEDEARGTAHKSEAMVSVSKGIFDQLRALSDKF